MDRPTYLTYYSKVRTGLTLNEEQERKYAQGKRATKIIEWRDIQADPKFIATLAVKMKQLAVRAETLMDVGPLEDRYTVFKIPKASGGFRTLEAPDAELKSLQIDIKNFLQKDCKLLCHNAVHSYVKGRNCKTAIEAHQAKHTHWFLKLDIKNFFDNCNDTKLFEMLTHIYPLCNLYYDCGYQLERMIKACMYHGALPQGAPTSPILSNLFLLQADVLLTDMYKEMCYTRYADDILISSTKEMQWKDIETEINFVLEQYGLELKTAKTRYGSNHGSNWNLGLMYNQDQRITVGHVNKHIMKCMLHNFYRDEATMTDAAKTTATIHINGLLGYYKFIEPEYYKTVDYIR